MCKQHIAREHVQYTYPSGHGGINQHNERQKKERKKERQREQETHLKRVHGALSTMERARMPAGCLVRCPLLANQRPALRQSSPSPLALLCSTPYRSGDGSKTCQYHWKTAAISSGSDARFLKAKQSGKALHVASHDSVPDNFLISPPILGRMRLFCSHSCLLHV